MCVVKSQFGIEKIRLYNGCYRKVWYIADYMS
ncbi:hypothetical protein BZ21_3464 [Yersinia pseudotuberculosis]|uniref:Transposase n=2 Tax=Yersinia pseudotuberculosis complex TaxID=1649845 RepID=A0AAX2HWG9_YERPE|nr:hypothetical protein BZ21_3464 [Yersinia pseudotuberculosis]AJJ14855.1 hypothetical protein CH46_1144 [Yersinia pestis]AJJ68075.1 hypothetical protein BZ16_3576 [Yersinia pseudotuberculosis PB1/+]AJJ82465.1 hypothetical protein CH56_1031 [Yersinia pestis Angola]AJJ86854.1 hypothetical protein AK38_2792 [Yersinia pestis CO92]AJK17095.1 hypothetical protein BZ19_3583 [Yersinia pseudotuberculosis str. PA3606]AKS56763.1 hypothetical protein M479_3857 [Yersinia pestis 1412]AKS80049.1 hypotheti